MQFWPTTSWSNIQQQDLDVVFWIKRQHSVLDHKRQSNSLKRRTRANDWTTMVWTRGFGLLGQKSRSLAGADLGQWRAAEARQQVNITRPAQICRTSGKQTAWLRSGGHPKCPLVLDQTRGGGFIPESRRLFIRAALFRVTRPGTAQRKIDSNASCIWRFD